MELHLLSLITLIYFKFVYIPPFFPIGTQFLLLSPFFHCLNVNPMFLGGWTCFLLMFHICLTYENMDTLLIEHSLFSYYHYTLLKYLSTFVLCRINWLYSNTWFKKITLRICSGWNSELCASWQLSVHAYMYVWVCVCTRVKMLYHPTFFLWGKIPQNNNLK